MMSVLSDQLAQLSEESLEEMSRVVYQNGWQDSGGVIPSFSNALGILRDLLGELRAADEEGLVDNMPVSLQRNLRDHLTNLVTHVRNIANGNQHVSAFTDTVDTIHTLIWQGGFRYRGKKLVGYEQKYTQIRALSKEIQRIKERESKAQALLDSVVAILNNAQTSATEFENAKTVALAQIAEITSVLSAAQAANTTIDTHLTTLETKLKEASDSASTADARAQTATALEKRIQTFATTVDDNEKRLNDAIQSAAGALAQNTKDIEQFKATKTGELDEFQKRLEVIEQDIRDKLSNATGIRLFKTLEEREGKISGHKWLWAAGIAAGVGIALTAAFFFTSNGTTDTLFYTKLSLGIPIAVLVGFALQQYGKERRLKEEYAFKAAISLSLNAYRELVEEATKSLVPDDKAKFADFLIHSVAIIFDSPTERVFGSRRVSGPTDSKVIANFLKTAKDAKGLFDGK
jgi:hypothetical protein